jgi:hypothetical protein
MELRQPRLCELVPPAVVEPFVMQCVVCQPSEQTWDLEVYEGVEMRVKTDGRACVHAVVVVL